MPDSIISQQDSVLCVVDIQEKLLPFISNKQQVVDQSAQLIRAAAIFDIPILLSEQVPVALGNTQSEIKQLIPDTAVIEKTSFACLESDIYIAALEATSRKTLVLCGLEAHVCIMLTALDALQKGYRVVVIANAIGSRQDLNHQVALQRLRTAGAIISTTEMMILEWTKNAKHSEFKDVIKLIK